MIIQQIFNSQIIQELKKIYIKDNIIRSKALTYKSVTTKFPEFKIIFEQNFSKDNFREVIYCILKDIPEIPNCKNPNCHNKTKLRNFIKGFQQCCSKQCTGEYQHLSESHKQKCRLGAINRYQLHPTNKLTVLKNYTITTDDNYYIIHNYCIHGNIKVYKKVAYNINDLKQGFFCYKCNEELFNNYVPSEIEIKEFQDIFPDFYDKNHHKMKYKWWITYYPKYLKIIITYFNRYIRKYNENKDNLLELYYVFSNKLTQQPTCTQCNKPVDFSYTGLCYRKFCDEHLYGFNNSLEEKTLDKFIKSLNIKYIKNDRVQINQELDFYFPNKNIAIEFNGCWWHCEKFKDKQYHYNKWKICQEKGIQLISIWEDDLLYKEKIIYNLIKSKLGLLNYKLYARECIVKVITYKESKQFIDTYHLQGNTIDKIRLGLFYNNELVSVMTFGKSRFNKNETELIRYCVKNDYQIIGGASKLFNYFINNYNYNKIISYAEADISNGNLYDILGFKYIGISENFKWLYRGIRYNRLNQVKDKNKDLIYKCYSSGILKYEYTH